MGFFPCSGCVRTTAWLHNVDADRMHREKARWEFHKNVTNYIEEIQKQTPWNNRFTDTYLPS